MAGRRKYVLRAVFFFLFLTAWVQTAAAAGTGIYDNRLWISDTLTYINKAANAANGRVESYALEYTPGGDLFAVVSSGSYIYGADTITTIIGELEAAGYNVLGGINADFFSMSTGIPMGNVIENGILKCFYNYEPTIGFLSDGSAFISSGELYMTLRNQGGGGNAQNIGQTVSIPCLNKFRTVYNLYLMDSSFSGNTRTTTAGREVCFAVRSGTVRVGGTVLLEVIDISDSSGAVAIPDGCMVLTADAGCPYIGELDKFSVGDLVELNVGTSDARLAEAVWATGGGDILVSDGTKTNSAGWDSALLTACPRTVLGIKADGSVLLYEMDGRQSGYSNGMSMNDLADEMIRLGCTYAINLDGGGSSSLSFRTPGETGASTKTSPSDGALRKCATFILLVSKNAGDGVAKQLYFSDDARPVLAGATVDTASLYDGLIATDDGYKPVSSVSGLTYTAPDTLGVIDGTRFAAGTADAAGTIAVTGENSAKGFLDVQVVTEPDTFSVARAGSESSPLSELRVSAGETIQLATVLSHNGSPLLTGDLALTYTVTGDVGTVSGDGLFAASDQVGAAGGLTVSIGGLEKTIPVTVASSFADTDGHWAQDYIEALGASGVISGDVTDAGTYFYPNNSLTRAEFSVLITRFLGLDADAYPSAAKSLADYDSIPSWARSYVNAAYGEGYMLGKATASGTAFDAYAPITRAEAFTVLARVMDGAADESVLDTFSDQTDIAAWARTGVALMVERGVVSGYTDGTMRPKNSILRCEAATILYFLSAESEASSE